MYQHCNIIFFFKMKVLKHYRSTILILNYPILVGFVLIIFGHIAAVVNRQQQ